MPHDRVHIVALGLARVLQQSALAQVEQGFVQVGAGEHLFEDGVFHRAAKAGNLAQQIPALGG